MLQTPNTDGLINWLRQSGLLLNQPPKSMRVNSFQLIKFCDTRTDPAAETKSIGLPADLPAGRQARWCFACLPAGRFFARHLDYFIMTQNSQSLPGLGTVKTNYRDPRLIVHLPGLAKNAAPRRGRQLN